MKKTIVLAIFTLQGNGAERFALTLAKGLIDAGHEAHIVYFKIKSSAIDTSSNSAIRFKV